MRVEIDVRCLSELAAVNLDSPHRQTLIAVMGLLASVHGCGQRPEVSAVQPWKTGFEAESTIPPECSLGVPQYTAMRHTH